MKIIQSKIVYPCHNCKHIIVIFADDAGRTIVCENCEQVHEIKLKDIGQGWYDLEMHPVEKQ